MLGPGGDTRTDWGGGRAFCFGSPGGIRLVPQSPPARGVRGPSCGPGAQPCSLETGSRRQGLCVSARDLGITVGSRPAASCSFDL